MEGNNSKKLRLEKPSDTYFKLVPPKKTWAEWVLMPFRLLFNVLINPFSIIFGRILTSVIFNPAKASNQDQDKVHHANNHKKPDLEHMGDFYVINVTSRPGFFGKSLFNLARKLQSGLFNLPDWFIRGLQNILGLNVLKENECDALVGRIVRAINEVEKGGATFDFDNLFIKGLEFIDEPLRIKTLELINTTLRKYSKRDDFDITKNTERANFFTLETVDHAVLDSVELNAKGETEKDIKERTYVIFCMPRENGYCAWLKTLKIAAQKANTTYIAFNYRGVQRSEGIIWTQDDMICDALAQAERLRLLGVKAENIAFEGECLGGAIATLAAAKMHKEGHKVKLFNARSFRSVFSIMLHFILPSDKASMISPSTWGRYLSAACFLSVGAPILLLSNWNLNVEKAWKSIPDEDKDFLVVRSPINVDGSRNVDDPTVDHQNGSIYSLDRETIKNNDELQFDKLHKHRFTVNPVNISASFENQPNPKTRNGHICQRYELIQREGNDKVDARAYTAAAYHRFWSKPKSQGAMEVEDKPFPACQSTG